MSKSVSFSFESEAEKKLFELHAKAKGLTLSAFVKTAAYRERNRYPIKKKEFKLIEQDILKIVQDALKNGLLVIDKENLV